MTYTVCFCWWSTDCARGEGDTSPWYIARWRSWWNDTSHTRMSVAVHSGR